MAENSRVLMVEANFYEDISEELAKGAIQVLDAAGVSYRRVTVPGAFEVPAAIRFAIRSGPARSAEQRFSGYIALGCVIRGETDHYEHICRETSRALMDLAVNFRIALGFGILTCENHAQAWARADVEQKNKGADAAAACLRMMEIERSLRLARR